MSDTPETDANEVNLYECISVETMGSGKQRYVIKYVPSYITRRLERERDALRAQFADAENVREANRLGYEAAMKRVEVLEAELAAIRKVDNELNAADELIKAEREIVRLRAEIEALKQNQKCSALEGLYVTGSPCGTYKIMEAEIADLEQKK